MEIRYDMGKYRHVRIRKTAAAVLLILFVLISAFSAYAETPGNEWDIISHEGSIREENTGYYNSLCDILKKNGGILNKRKYTDYSKTVLALTAAGYDPSNVHGYDLLSKLEESETVEKQGLNGPVWALIALDSGSYKSSKRQEYISYILDRELPGGGFNMEGKGDPDPDVTAMAIQALSNYCSADIKVKDAVDRGITVLSKMQNADGGYSSWGTANSESVSQVIIALTHAGIDINDERFVKNGKTALDNLMTFRLPDGTFMHVKESGKTDPIATEQAKTALSAVDRIKNGKKPLYRIK